MSLIETHPTDRERFGAKATLLIECERLGLAIPPSFTIAAEIRQHLTPDGASFPEAIERQIREAIAQLEERSGATFGGKDRPLLLAVRSGAPISMPGMLGTVLDVGLTPQTFAALERTSGKRFAIDCKLRLLRSFGEVALALVAPDGHGSGPIVGKIDRARQEQGVNAVSDLPEAALEALVQTVEALLIEQRDRSISNDPWQQLFESIAGVIQSWDSPRARAHRKQQNLSEAPGTAVMISAMVFGNRNRQSGSGAVFTREPTTGENKLYGEFLPLAQGDELTSGLGTPAPLDGANRDSLQRSMPDVYHALTQAARKIERHFRAPQELEFTVDHGKLWLLQTRPALLTAQSRVKTAVEMVYEGLIKPEEALAAVSPADLEPVLQTTIAPEVPRAVIAKGLPASPGAATGAVVFTSADAELRSKREDVILVRLDASPEDVPGIRASKGILTARGGTTSHAAVIARALGRVCVVGAKEVLIDPRNKQFVAREHTVTEGQRITIDGKTGEVILGALTTTAEARVPESERLLAMADRAKRLGVWALASDQAAIGESRRQRAEGLVIAAPTAYEASELARSAAELPNVVVKTLPRASFVAVLSTQPEVGEPLLLDLKAGPDAVRRTLEDAKSGGTVFAFWGEEPPDEDLVFLFDDLGAALIAVRPIRIPSLRLAAGRAATRVTKHRA